jgi:hypothetical protein
MYNSGEKVSGYKLQCQKVYLAVLHICTTGGEKVSGYKLQCQKVYLAALPKCTTGGEKERGNKLLTFSPPVVHLGRSAR